MEKKEKLSLNALLKESVMQIIGDNQEHSVEDIRDSLDHVYGLQYEKDYRKEHLGVAIYALKREGELVSVGRGRYLAGNMKQENDFVEDHVCREEKELSCSERVEDVDYVVQIDGVEPGIVSHNLMIETRKTLISVIESHYQTCMDILSAINQFDYLEASDRDLAHVSAMLKYKKGLESHLKELKKDL